MGVPGLWELAAPAATTVELSTLRQKRLAVDASIWMHHFLKAMRDKDGNMIAGAHMIGFFNRICKLLWLQIWPIFVFDGPPSELKRRTLRKRIEQRELGAVNLKKVAERLVRQRLREGALKAKEPASQSHPESQTQALVLEGSQKDKEELEDLKIVSQESESESESEGKKEKRPTWIKRKQGAFFKEFIGFLNNRRGLDDVEVSEKAGAELKSRLLSMPNRTANSEAFEEWKGYEIEDENGRKTIVKLPLGGFVDPETFDSLPGKAKYDILIDLQDAWLNDTRLMAVEAKNNAKQFSNIQLEAYYRQIRTNKMINQAKEEMAEKMPVEDAAITFNASDLRKALGYAPRDKNAKPGGGKKRRRKQLKVFDLDDEPKMDFGTSDPMQMLGFTASSSSSSSAGVIQNRLPMTIVDDRPQFARALRGGLVDLDDSDDDDIDPIEDHISTKRMKRENVTGNMSTMDVLVSADGLVDPGASRAGNMVCADAVDPVSGLPFGSSNNGNVDRDLALALPLCDMSRSSSSKDPPLPLVHNMPARCTGMPESSTSAEGGTHVSSGGNLGLGFCTLEGSPDVSDMDKIESKKNSDTINTMNLGFCLPEDAGGDKKRRRSEDDDNDDDDDDDDDDDFGLSSPESGAHVGNLSFGAKRSDVAKETDDVDFGLVSPRESGAGNTMNTSNAEEEAIGIGKKNDDNLHDKRSPCDNIGDIDGALNLLFGHTTPPGSDQNGLVSPSIIELNKRNHENDIDYRLKKNITILPHINDHVEALSSSPAGVVVDLDSECSESPRMVAVDVVSDDEEGIFVTEVIPASAPASEPMSLLSDSECDIVGETDAAQEIPSSPSEKVDDMNEMNDDDDDVQEIKSDAGESDGDNVVMVLSESDACSDRMDVDGASTRDDVVVMLPEGNKSPLAGVIEESKQAEETAHHDDGPAKEPHEEKEEKVEAGRHDDGPVKESHEVNPPDDNPPPEILVDNNQEALIPQASETAGEEEAQQAVLNTSDTASVNTMSNELGGGDFGVEEPDFGEMFGEGEISLEEALNGLLGPEDPNIRRDMLRAKRDMDVVTTDMTADVRKLLEAFGIPFVTASEEAEAQCAVLAELGLCEGVVTDDSDVLVFGATEVYRHLFKDKASCYTGKSVQSEMGLRKADLICLAMLLGCDYTDGVKGIGIVNGMEVVEAWCMDSDEPLQRLRDFRRWAEDSFNDHIDPENKTIPMEYAEKHKNLRHQWTFPDDFASYDVWEAFEKPVVSYSKEAFSFGLIDKERVVSVLKPYMSHERIDRILEPVLKRYHSLQAPVWAPVERVASIRSKRMQRAVDDMKKKKGPYKVAGQ